MQKDRVKRDIRTSIIFHNVKNVRIYPRGIKIPATLFTCYNRDRTFSYPRFCQKKKRLSKWGGKIAFQVESSRCSGGFAVLFFFSHDSGIKTAGSGRYRAAGSSYMFLRFFRFSCRATFPRVTIRYDRSARQRR